MISHPSTTVTMQKQPTSGVLLFYTCKCEKVKGNPDFFFFNCHEFCNCVALLLMKPWEGRKEKHVSVEKTHTKTVVLGNINKTKIKLSYLLVLCLNQMYSELLQTQMSKCTLHGNNTARTDQIGAESPEQLVSTDGKNFVLFLKKKKIWD